jgi:SAM-dependent methyltransferase
MGDLERLEDEYIDREQRFAGSDFYSLENPANRFMRTGLYNAIAELGIFRDVKDAKILEMGCGNGNVLDEFHERGAGHLFGIDLLFWRLQQGRLKKNDFPFACADGQFSPFPADTFDVIVQFTVFSSILDDGLRRNMAEEMKRILKPNGVILWYDFIWNPLNQQTRGIRLGEIKRLFTGMQVWARRETLAPPITRHLIHVSPSLCAYLARLKILNSHYLALIKPADYAAP